MTGRCIGGSLTPSYQVISICECRAGYSGTNCERLTTVAQIEDDTNHAQIVLGETTTKRVAIQRIDDGSLFFHSDTVEMPSATVGDSIFVRHPVTDEMIDLRAFALELKARLEALAT